MPSRARKVVKTGDIIVAKNISSLGSVAIINEDFNNQLVSTGFIVIRPKGKETPYLLWAIFRNEIVKQQMYYLSATAVQPEVSEKIFKSELLIPIPNKITEKQKFSNNAKNIERLRQTINDKIRIQDKSLKEYFNFTTY